MEARKREPRALKRLQVAENTEREMREKAQHRGHGGRSTGVTESTPRGNSDGYQNKGLARQESGGQAGKAIRKVVKTKGQQKTT
jgi:hypothetical protein